MRVLLRVLLVPALALPVLGRPAGAQAIVCEAVGAHGVVSGSGGRTIAGVGDVDGDGVGDFVAGAAADGAGGRVTVFSGASGAVVWEVFGAAGDDLGAAVAAAGDVDGDGVVDVLVGAPGADVGAVDGGRGSVRSGNGGGVVATTDGSVAGERLGAAVDGGRDFDGDGVPDRIVGGEDRTLVVAGTTDATLFDLAVVGGGGAALRRAALGDFDGDGEDDFAIARPNAWVRVRSGTTGAVAFELPATEPTIGLGASIADAGDVDGDGVTDLAIGATGCLQLCQTPGRVIVVGGVTRDELLVVHGPSYEAGFGARLDRAGDVDGDGVPDLVVGAPHHAESGVDAGSVAVVSGADGETRFRVLGDAAGDRLGREVAGAGDVDGDGVPDLVVAKLPSAAAPGFARVLSGGRPEVRVGRTMVGALAAQPVAPDVDEVHLHAVFGTKLKVRTTTLSGDLAPRVRVFGPAGEALGTLDFAGGGKKTKSLKLETTGLHRLRVEGRKAGGTPTTGTYRVETDAKFGKKAGAFTAKRSGKPGEWMSVRFHALPGAVLDARVVPKKGFAVSAPPAVRLRAPGGALLAAGPFLVLDDGDVLLAGVPLSEVGEYRIEVQAAPAGKSKMKVKVDLAQPTGDGEYAVP